MYKMIAGKEALDIREAAIQQLEKSAAPIA